MTRIGPDTLPNAHDLNAALSEIKDALGAKRYGEAINSAEGLVQRHPTFGPALVILVTGVQLSEDGRGYGLGDCRELLAFAAYLEGMGGDASHEYGRFLFAVANSAAEALHAAAGPLQKKTREVIELLGLHVDALTDPSRVARAEALLRRAQELATEVDRFVGAKEQG